VCVIFGLQIAIEIMSNRHESESSGDDGGEVVTISGVGGDSMWNGLPDIPFYRICSFLDHKDIYGNVARTCRSFHARIGGENEIVVQRLNLVEPSVWELEKLSRKILSCNVLYIEALHTSLTWLNKSGNVVSNFLTKLSAKVLQVHCKVSVRDQDVVIPFLNECKCLRELELDVEGCCPRWDWDKHTVQPTMKHLALKSCCQRSCFIF
jgi:hypothetical protein